MTRSGMSAIGMKLTCPDVGFAEFRILFASEAMFRLQG